MTQHTADSLSAADAAGASTFGQVTGAGKERVYTTKAGDTLEDIAAVFYGDPVHKRRLVAQNPELTPDLPVLPPGMRLRVPEDID